MEEEESARNPSIGVKQVRSQQTKAAKQAARKEKHERIIATKAANMRKRALPEEDGSDGDGIDVRAPRYTPHKNTP